MNATLINSALAVVISGGSPTGPIETFSSPLSHPGGDVVACIVQNLGEQAVTVDAVLRRPNGSAADSGQADVPPGRTIEIASSGDDSVGLHCTFNFDADPDTVRGYIHRRPSAGGDTLALFGSSAAVRSGEIVKTVMISPPLRSINTEILACLVQNLSDEAVEVETALVGEDGNVIDSSTNDVPGRTVTATVVSDGDHLNSYCGFGFDAVPDEVRGYAILFDNSPMSAHLVFPASTGGGAGALVAYSPVVSSVAGDATICLVQNFGDMPLPVSAELIDSTGVLDDGNIVVQPGQVATVAGQTDGASNGYCKFDFTNEGDSVRGFITRFPPGLFASTDLLEPLFSAAGPVVLGFKTYGPPLRVEDGQLHCVIENVTDGDVPVHVEIDDGTGTIIDAADVVAALGSGTTALTTTVDLTDGFCTFTFDGSPSGIRTFAVLTNAAGTRSRLIFAAEARGPEPIDTPTPTETTTQRPTFTHTQSPTLTGTTQPTVTPTTALTPTATEEPTEIPTDIPTATMQPSATPTSTPEETPAITPTPTLEPTATPVPCIGDCDGDGSVTVDEILKMVNIALGSPVEECPAGDRDGDGAITVDEILAAVANALRGCPG